ncbi:hypothetical protein HGRIS_010175 [Hohenbuehelia grisea]|uniref:DUF5648 domain-containing protein n=1 Tax=Hohenbuehelia grisea TaxID=104357 RepID=A0ABR3J3H2_9AGAR
MKLSAAFVIGALCALQLSTATPIMSSSDTKAVDEAEGNLLLADSVLHEDPYGGKPGHGHGSGHHDSHGPGHGHGHKHEHEHGHGYPHPPPPPPPPPPPHDHCHDARTAAVNFYRSYNGAGVDHFYTTNEAEWNGAVAGGWAKEGVAARIMNKQVHGSVPLYRLYQAQFINHFYTTNAAERQTAITTHKYNDEGIAGYVFPDGRCGTKPLYRMYQHQIPNGNVYPGRVYGGYRITSDHFYTTDANERNNAVGKLYYADEGVVGYVF